MRSLPIDTAVRPIQSFVGLTAEEQGQLAAWATAARTMGIEAVEDLGHRPWPVPTEAAILGIYRTGDRFASWMIVGRSGDWALASCADGSVIGAASALIDLLAEVCRVSDPIGSA